MANAPSLYYQAVVVKLLPDRVVLYITSHQTEAWITARQWPQVFTIKNKKLYYKNSQDLVQPGDVVQLFFPRPDQDAMLVSLQRRSSLDDPKARATLEELSKALEEANRAAQHSLTDRPDAKQAEEVAVPPLHPLELQIGMSKLVVPPAAIRIDRVSSLYSTPVLRSRGSFHRSIGHKDTRITIQLVFPDLESINDPQNGLRALIAQFMRTPLLPVKNYFLNDLQNIHSVALGGLSIDTIPHFPHALSAQLILFQFDHVPYLPHVVDFYDAFEWPYFEWYVRRGLLEPKEGEDTPRLKPYPPAGATPALRFEYLPIQVLAQRASFRWSIAKGNAPELIPQAKRMLPEVLHDLALLRVALLHARYHWSLIAQQPLDERKPHSVHVTSLSKNQREAIQVLPIDPGGLATDYLLEFPDPRAHELRIHLRLQYEQVIGKGDLQVETYIGNDGQPQKLGLYNTTLVLRNGELEYAGSRLIQLVERAHAYYTRMANDPNAALDPVVTLLEMQDEYYQNAFELYPMPYEDVHIESASVGFTNVLARHHMQKGEAPVYQYLGCQDIFLRLDLTVTSDQALEALQRLFDYSQMVVQEYYNDIANGYLKIVNPLAQLVGLQYVLPHSFNVQTVPNQPGVYQVDLTLVDARAVFDKRKRGALLVGSSQTYINFIKGGDPRSVPGYAVIVPNDPIRSDDQNLMWARLVDVLSTLELYPDLELPTREEFEQRWGKLPAHLDNGGLYLDPDFYIKPSRDIQRDVEDLLKELYDQSMMAYDPETKQWLSIPFGTNLTKYLADHYPLDLSEVDEFKPMWQWNSPQMANLPTTAHAAAVVQGVVDGDTFVGIVSFPNVEARQMHVRLLGIDTPETRHPEKGLEALGPIAKTFLQSLLHPGMTVYLELDKNLYDDYGRLLAYVYLPDGRMVNEIILREGLAKPLSIYPNQKYKQRLQEAYNEGKKMAPWLDPTRYVTSPDEEHVRALQEAARRYLRISPEGSQVEYVPAAGVTGNTQAKDSPPSEVLIDPLDEPGPQQKPAERQIAGALHDFLEYGRYDRLVRAFPTFYAFFVDEGLRVRWLRLWDNLYGFNAIDSIDVIKSRRSPADTCYLRFVNNYEYFNLSYELKVQEERSRTLKFRLLDWVFLTLSGNEDLIAAHADPHRDYWVRPGSRLHLRMGYGSNLARLPVLFNGTVTQIGSGELVEVIAQGDGIELLRKVRAGLRSTTNTYSLIGKLGLKRKGHDVRDILVRIMMAPDDPGLRSPAQFLRNAFHDDPPVLHFGSPLWGTPLFAFSGELAQNIYSSLENTDIVVPAWQNVFGHGKMAKDDGRAVLLNIHLHNKTIWDVARIAASACPNYIVAVHPFEFRSTLFFGKPHWDLAYAYDIIPPERIQTRVLKDDKEWVIYNGRTFPIHHAVIEMVGEVYWFEDHTGRRWYQFGSVWLSPRTKPYAQFHIYSSIVDIIDNQIGIDGNAPIHYAIATFRNPGLSGSLSSASGSTGQVEVFADKDIHRYQWRTAVLETGLAPSEGILLILLRWLTLGVADMAWDYTKNLAYNAGASQIKESWMDLYRGDLIILGDPSVKPYDLVYLADTYSEMTGLIGVKQVHHHLSVESGFVTAIVPDMLVSAQDPEEYSWWGSLAMFGGGLLSHRLSIMAVRSFLWSLQRWSGAAIAARGALMEASAAAAEAALARQALVSAGRAFLTRAWSGILSLSLRGISTAAGAGAALLDVSALTAPVISIGSIALSPIALIAAAVTVVISTHLRRWWRNVVRSAQCIYVRPIMYHGKPMIAKMNGARGIQVSYDTWAHRLGLPFDFRTALPAWAERLIYGETAEPSGFDVFAGLHRIGVPSELDLSRQIPTPAALPPSPAPPADIGQLIAQTARQLAGQPAAALMGRWTFVKEVLRRTKLQTPFAPEWTPEALGQVTTRVSYPKEPLQAGDIVVLVMEVDPGHDPITGRFFEPVLDWLSSHRWIASAMNWVSNKLNTSLSTDYDFKRLFGIVTNPDKREVVLIWDKEMAEYAQYLIKNKLIDPGQNIPAGVRTISLDHPILHAFKTSTRLPTLSFAPVVFRISPDRVRYGP